MGEFQRYREMWEADRGKACSARKAVQHPVTGKKFKSELETLHRMTGDIVFKEALAALDRWKLVDEEGRWQRRFTKKPINNHVGTIIDLIDRRLNRGISLRLSCAHLAWELDVKSETFSSAVDYIERLYREGRANANCRT